ncbi:Protein of unknown function [Poseidonocella pacifica]|uniref:Lipopolysaccharide assembly protein A domain-containing protein n=1 Tax=Poseidonocella pacifica TaxID=871651 RepID=A0A1I0WFT3_9RHOB|nr:LapA family protein [Poseidonocella pacifica]SFA86806.1 Protein of unknown function [Poseidonocella pacifica]
MRYIRYASIAIFAIALITIGLANRGAVTLQLVPEELMGVAAVAPSVQLPLFVVIFFSILTGLLVGFVWEWFREHALRVEKRRKEQEVDTLRREVTKLKGESRKERDDVLALLEDAG